MAHRANPFVAPQKQKNNCLVEATLNRYLLFLTITPKYA
jgi:hypothetical protein